MAYHLLRGDQRVDYASLVRALARSRFYKTRPVVTWLLCGDENVGSSRIHGFNISRELNRQGIFSYIIQKPQKYSEKFNLDEYTRNQILRSKIDVVMLQKVHKNAESFIDALRAHGKKSIFVMADFFPSDLPAKCDHVIVVSDALKNLLVGEGVSASGITVIPDAIETDGSLCKDYSAGSGRAIRVVWVGNQHHWGSLHIINDALSDSAFSDYELISISDHRNATIQWRLDRVWDDILACDIAVIPADVRNDINQARSNNRLTMYKTLGLPVVCSPLAEYKKIVTHGVNGYFAETLQDWRKCLDLLRDGEVRKRTGLAGRERIIGEYGLPHIAGKYRDVILRTVAGQALPDDVPALTTETSSGTD